MTHSPPPAIIRHVAAGRAPVGPRIARVALSLVGSQNRRYYPNPRTACAAFVSHVLRKAEVLPRSQGSASAAVLANRLARRGWQRSGPMTTARARTFSRPGDVLFFHWCPGGRISHVTVATGGGGMVGTSSSRRVVTRYWIKNWRPRSHCVRVFRRK